MTMGTIQYAHVCTAYLFSADTYRAVHTWSYCHLLMTALKMVYCRRFTLISLIYATLYWSISSEIKIASMWLVHHQKYC